MLITDKCQEWPLKGPTKSSVGYKTCKAHKQTNKKNSFCLITGSNAGTSKANTRRMDDQSYSTTVLE